MIGSYQVLPLRARVDLRAMAMKEYFTIPKDCLVSYPGHLWVEIYPSAETQSVYSAAPADWAILVKIKDLDHRYNETDKQMSKLIYLFLSVMVVIVGNGIGNMSSNPGLGLKESMRPLVPLQPWVNRVDWVL